jgi:hypothetical protein
VRKVLLSIVGTAVAVIMMLSCVVVFSCNDKYDNPIDPKGGTGGDTTATDTTGTDTTGGTDTTIDFRRPILRREKPRAETFYSEAITWEYGMEITDSSIWLSNPNNTIDTLLFFNFTATVINMAANKVVSFYWYLNDSDIPDYTTNNGKLKLDWLYHGKVRVICIDGEGVASLPDSFMVFPKYPPRPLVRVMEFEGEYGWVKVDWSYENCKKEEIERYLDFYGDSVNVYQASGGYYNTYNSFPRYYPSYINYAKVDNENKINDYGHPIYWYTSYYMFSASKSANISIGINLVNVKGYAAYGWDFYWF